MLAALEIEQLLELNSRILGTGDRVTDGPRILIDLIVVSALVGLVAKEVNGSVRDTTGLLGLVLEVLQAVGLVPAGGEDVERDLAADAEGQAKVTEALAQLADERLADLVDLVVGLVVVALLRARVPADRRHVDHAVAELDEGAALDGDVQVGNVVQDEGHELLVLRLTNPLDEAVGGKSLAVLWGGPKLAYVLRSDRQGQHKHPPVTQLLILDTSIAGVLVTYCRQSDHSRRNRSQIES